MIVTDPTGFIDYHASLQQDFGIDASAPAVDPEYLESLAEYRVEPYGLTRISFVPPAPLSLSVVQINDGYIDVDFGATMKVDAAFLDVASYNLDESVGAGVAVAITAVTLTSVHSVRLTVSLGTNAEQYRFEVVGDVRQGTGETIVGTASVYVASVDPPRVVAVSALSATSVEVTFSRDMTNNADLVDPTKYRFDNGLFAAVVERTGARTVVVTTSQQIEGAVYSLRVFP